MTNGVAESVVKLITDYAEILTKDEVTRELLLAGGGAPPAQVPRLPKEDRSICVLDYSVLEYMHLSSACLSAFCVLGRI